MLIRMKTFLLCLAGALTLTTTSQVLAQAPGVKIIRDRGEEFDALNEKVGKLRRDGKLLASSQVKKEISRTNCALALPESATKKLADRDLWRRSQEAHVRLGWNYQCTKCDKWHLNLAGGSFITADGAIATCYHVIKPDSKHRESFLVAADDAGNVYPVTEVLAADEAADVAIVRAKVEEPVKALSLNANVYPGDGAWCYSDPLGRSSYFSKGMVNRFFYQEGKPMNGPRLEVSTDWAPGSSGAAVVDESANIIGFVSTIQSAGSSRSTGTNRVSTGSSPTMIVFHCAARAADVLNLVQPPAKTKTKSWDKR